MPKFIKVFIYGTLKSGFRNNDKILFLKGKKLGQCKTVDKMNLFDIGDGFPYLQKAINKGEYVIGELWELPEDSISTLDDFEGVPFLYKRSKINIVFNDEIIEVSTYLKSKYIDEDEIIPIIEYID